MTISFLKGLLIASGEILKNEFCSISSYNTKQDQSNIVTESDFKSEEAIRELITKSYPDHNIIGEEHGFENKKSTYTWIIDPLDGTSNFATGLPWFGILIALLQKNDPVLAGAYLPVSEELYLAEKGKGTFKNGQKITVSTETELKNILCCYSLDFSEDINKTDREVRVIKSLVNNCRNLRSTNSLVDFCYVADGRLGAALNQTMKIWDIAAPKLILEEAGAQVTDIHGQNLVFNPSHGSLTQNFTAVAANPIIHKEILHLISR